MMFARISLMTLLAISLGAIAGCEESSVNSNRLSNPAVEQPLQSPVDATEQSSDENESSATSESHSADADQQGADLRVDVDKEGVDVKVGEAVDVTVGDEGVDVDVQSKHEGIE
ncbi:MAG: hypothetical protein R3E01_01855 [Pirellulaceae bacterium]